jgi:hypothetical protein
MKRTVCWLQKLKGNIHCPQSSCVYEVMHFLRPWRLFWHRILLFVPSVPWVCVLGEVLFVGDLLCWTQLFDRTDWGIP